MRPQESEGRRTVSCGRVTVNSLPLWGAAVALIPLVALTIAASVAAAIIAFAGGHVILGLLCLPMISVSLTRRWRRTFLPRAAAGAPRLRLSRRGARRLLVVVVLVARVALAVVGAQWIVLALAVALPLAMLAYAAALARAFRRLGQDLAERLRGYAGAEARPLYNSTPYRRSQPT